MAQLVVVFQELPEKKTSRKLGKETAYTNTHAGNKSASIYHAQVAVRAEEETNPQDPDKTQLPHSPYTADFVADNKCACRKTHQRWEMEEQKLTRKARLHSQQSAGHRANLNHGRDISFDLGAVVEAVRVVVDGLLKVLAVEGASDQALVHTPGGAQESKGDDGKPEPPVEHLGGEAEVLQLEDVDGFFGSARHCAFLLAVTLAGSGRNPGLSSAGQPD